MRLPIFPLIVTHFLMLLLMFMLDLIWLDNIAKPLYQNGIGHLMAAAPRLGFAALFYVVYVCGLIFYGIWPHRAAVSYWQSAKSGALFGLFVYASYDLTNLALLKNWPLGLSLIDISWGVSLSAVVAAFGHFVWRKLAANYQQ